MNKKEYFISELEGIREVPTLPQIAFKLIALISNSSSSMREIGELIQDDPPLVAKILRIVNSGYYHVRNRIKNIRQAVVLLGMEEMRNLIFALSVFSTFYHIKGNKYFDFMKFWKHSAATGKVTMVLANYMGLSNATSTFIHGLLHDFGRLILQLYFRDEYESVFEFSIEHEVPLYEAELKVMEFGHDEAGAWLAEKWNLPEDVKETIRDHHRIDPEKVEKKVVPALVYVADCITNIWGVGIEPFPRLTSLEENPIWLKLQEVYPKMKTFPLEEMTRIFDMHLEEAELFAEQISQYHRLAEDTSV